RLQQRKLPGSVARTEQTRRGNAERSGLRRCQFHRPQDRCSTGRVIRKPRTTRISATGTIRVVRRRFSSHLRTKSPNSQSLPGATLKKVVRHRRPPLAWSTEQPVIILLAAAAGKIWYCLPDRIVMGDIFFRLKLNQSWEAIDIQTGADMVIPKGSY